MSEVKRVISILIDVLRPYYSSLRTIREDTLICENDIKRAIYTVKIFPPSEPSVQILKVDVVNFEPQRVFIVSQIEDWLYAVEDALSGMQVKVSRVSPIDIMSAGFLPFSEHIGIAVRDAEEAERKFYDVLGVRSSGKHKVESEGLIASFIWIGSTRVELLEPFSQDSAVKSFLDKRGEGIHHIAVEVEDFDKRIEELKNKGYKLIGPRIGATGKRVVFIHPKDFMGILLEIVEKGYREKSFEHD